MNPRYKSDCRGFTLLEIIVVISLAALAAAMISLKWSSPIQRVQLDRDVERFLSFDRLLRAYCHETRKPVLVLITDDGTSLQFADPTDCLLHTPRFLSSRLTVANTITGENLTEISYCMDGSTETFVATFDTGLENQVVGVIGGSGEHWIPNDEKEIRQFRQHSMPIGINAD